MQNVSLRRIVLLAVLALACLPAAASAVTPAPAARPAARIFLDAPTLAKLKLRAQQNDPAWLALRTECDKFSSDPNTVHFPDDEANAYPDDGGIGKGYEGIGYYPPMMDLGLCYQTELALGNDPTRTAKYALLGTTLLDRISRPPGDPHSQPTNEDDEYDIRFFGTAMAVGYDWFYPAMATNVTLRTQVANSLKLWINDYEHLPYLFTGPFPQGNYYAGYYEAKALAGIALANDADPAIATTGNAILADWLTRIQAKFVQPYYARSMAGGGWSEGWNYGPFASQNMTLPALAAKTALGIDLVHDPAHPYVYPVGLARFLLYFAWPDMNSLEDADKVSNDDNPTLTMPFMYTSESGMLNAFADPFAPYFASFSNSIRQHQQGNELFDGWDTWENFLLWDPKQPMKSYRTLPLSYHAPGIEMAAVRSDWTTNAVWGSFKSGTFTNNPDNGEEWFDQGSLAIMNGTSPLVVNASGALLRNTPGTSDGTQFENPVQDNVLQGNADIFNVFYVNNGSGWGQTNRLAVNVGGTRFNAGARTKITSFHDAGTYTMMTGTHLEDMYSPGRVNTWTRTVAYVRPGIFVVYDKTAIPNPSFDQWMAFAFEKQPTLRSGGTGGAKRYEVRGPLGYGGNVDTVLPAGHRDSFTNLFNKTKVVQLQIRPGQTAPGQTAAAQSWLTVFDAAKSPAESYQPAPLKAIGEAAGVLLHRHGGNEAILLGGNSSREVRYSVPLGPTLHVVGGLKPGATYTLHASHGAIDLRRGPGQMADATGTLAFRTR